MIFFGIRKNFNYLRNWKEGIFYWILGQLIGNVKYTNLNLISLIIFIIWKINVYINNKNVGVHTGGYSYFYFDITNYLTSGKNIILWRVIDVTDTWGKYQPVGKQTITRYSKWYTPAPGIWQTVWLEPVNENYIEKLEINNDFDNEEIKIIFKVANDIKLPIELNVCFNGKLVGSNKGKSNEEISINFLFII